MKALIKTGLLLFVVIAWQSCDKIEGPVKETVEVIPGSRKVLVEDYTGHTCGNCPSASRILYNDLKPIYGDRLIIMAVHAGHYADTYPPQAPYFTYNFKTPEGTTLDTDFGISNAGNPNGMVNRRMVDGSYIIGKTKWGSEVANVLNDASPVPVNLHIINDFDSTSRSLNTEVEMEFSQTLNGTYKLCVFVVEDSIVNWQKDYENTTVPQNNVQDYLHHEALRTSMNGTYGETVSGTTENNTTSLSYNTTLPLEWNAQQISIIAYIYRDDTKEIIQVEQAHIIE
jgi:hypothetical protein